MDHSLEHCGFWVADGVRAEQSLIERIASQGIVVCPTAGIAPGTPPPPPPVAARLPAMIEVTARMHRAGVRLLAGTDAGVGPAKPHGGTAHAVRSLAEECGLSTMEALQSATSWSAEACGLGGRKGVLAAGADADVLVVGGNVLEDLAALHDVRMVFRAGVVVGSEDGGQPDTASIAVPKREIDRSTISSLAVSDIRK